MREKKDPPVNAKDDPPSNQQIFKDDEEAPDIESTLLFTDELDEDMANKDILRMQQALAPQLADLEDILRDMPGISSEYQSNLEDIAVNTSLSLEQEDDDLDDEWQNLSSSEQILREELEFAQSFSQSMLANSPTNQSMASEITIDQLPSASSGGGAPPPKSPLAPVAYTLQDHAEFLQLWTEKVGGWYFCDMTKFCDLVSPADASGDLIRDYCLPIPFRKLKRIYSGLIYYDVHPTLHGSPLPSLRPATPSTTSAPATTTTTTAPAQPPQTPPVGTSTPQTPATIRSMTTNDSSDQVDELSNILEESSSPMMEGRMDSPPTITSIPSSLPQEEPLPVRTVAIHIRPDVLCGAVMDALAHALIEVLGDCCHVVILKRQGGHLRAAITMTWNLPLKNNGHQDDKWFVNMVVDAQLCTLKNEWLDRRLVVRFYHVQDDLEATQELSASIATERNERSIGSDPDNSTCTGTNHNQERQETLYHASIQANRHLKQACSLIQRLMAQQSYITGNRESFGGSPPPKSAWLGLSDTAFANKSEMQRAIGLHLESNFKNCPSVREENKKASPTIRRLTLPSLSIKDWPLLVTSWTITHTFVEELETRDISYNTLSTAPFGQFPALPTLDVQYCSQLRRLSREAMITQLLKAAKELEDYAKSAEYNCANLLTLLEPMVHYYRIPPITLPRAKSLESYPLDYTPPQLSCPPWGQAVMEALNQIAAATTSSSSSKPNSHPEMDATTAIKMVYTAFMKQDDHEQGARLGRKNAQVMDRLAMLQSHQRAVINSIQDAQIHSRIARRAADDFLERATLASNVGQPGYPRMLHAQVPLLTFRISVGGSLSGTAYVTSHQLLFSTSYISLLRSKFTLFDLKQVEFIVDDTVGSTILNPFPNTMIVKYKDNTNGNNKNISNNNSSKNKQNDKPVFSFRPSIAAKRLQNFLVNLQTFQQNRVFSEPDRIVVEEEGILRLADTVSDDQLSI